MTISVLPGVTISQDQKQKKKRERKGRKGGGREGRRNGKMENGRKALCLAVFLENARN